MIHSFHYNEHNKSFALDCFGLDIDEVGNLISDEKITNITVLILIVRSNMGGSLDPKILKLFPNLEYLNIGSSRLKINENISYFLNSKIKTISYSKNYSFHVLNPSELQKIKESIYLYILLNRFLTS